MLVVVEVVGRVERLAEIQRPGVQVQGWWYGLHTLRLGRFAVVGA